MTTLPTTIKPTPWKATARTISAALIVLAKATWWITKHSFLLIIGFWVVVGKTAWTVFLKDDRDSNHSQETGSIFAEEGELGIDEHDKTSFNGPGRIKVH